MSNINWNQFSNNFNGLNFNNIQNNPLNNNANLLPPEEQRTPMEVLFPKYIAQLKDTSSELAVLNQQQTVNMLKDLLKLPKNFEQLLTQMLPNAKQSDVQTALFLLASNIDLSKLSSLLQNNSKEAMTNLYQMLAQFNQIGMRIKDEQVNSLTKLITFVAASSSSDVQTLRTTMLMYLPWLPLTNPESFKLELSSGGGENNGANDDSITILISTENYGNLQADIYKTAEDGIKIELVSSETFPQKDFKILMKEESKKYSININFELSIKEAFNKKKNETANIQVCMNTSSGVNPFLLLISNSLIKNVHIIDSKKNLIEKRKERPDGKS